MTHEVILEDKVLHIGWAEEGIQPKTKIVFEARHLNHAPLDLREYLQTPAPEAVTFNRLQDADFPPEGIGVSFGFLEEDDFIPGIEPRRTLPQKIRGLFVTKNI